MSSMIVQLKVKNDRRVIDAEMERVIKVYNWYC